MFKYSYFDNAATTKVSKTALDDYINAINLYPSNPSAIYKSGIVASNAIEEARDKLSKILNAKSKDLYFCSSGTEANNIYISSLINKQNKGKILVSAIEHASSYYPTLNLSNYGYEVVKLKIGKNGLIDLDFFKENLDKSVKAVIIMHVNNELGTIQEIENISKIIRKFEKDELCSIHFHVDAVQSFCKIKLDLTKLKIDSASFSSHKIHAPRGVGLLYCKKAITPIYLGGGQENSIRPGTENTAGIIAFANEAERQYNLMKQNFTYIMGLKNKLINELSSDKIFRIYNKDIHEASQSPYILSLNVSPIPAEVLTRVLDSAGFAVSSGSACSEKTTKNKKYALLASKLSEKEAFSTIRISFSTMNTEEEVNELAKTLKREVNILKEIIR